jgi:hypothetical protein
MEPTNNSEGDNLMGKFKNLSIAESQPESDPYRCPFCLEDGICIQPHIDPQHIEAFNDYILDYFNMGYRSGYLQASLLFKNRGTVPDHP